MEQEIYATKEDLQSLRADLTKIIGDVETKVVGTMASVEQRMMERIASSEQRMVERIASTDQRMMERIASSEQRMMERIASTDQRIARLDGQFMVIIRLNYFMAASLLAMAVKVIFFPS